MICIDFASEGWVLGGLFKFVAIWVKILRIVSVGDVGLSVLFCVAVQRFLRLIFSEATDSMMLKGEAIRVCRW